MAVTRKNQQENIFADNGQSATNQKTNQQQTNQQVKSIGFGTGIPLIVATKGSEYTNSITKVINDIYSDQSLNHKVNVFDKEQLPNLEYSCIVVSHPNKRNEICYHITILEATGNEPMRASDIVAEASKVLRDHTAKAFIHTPDDAINGFLHTIVQTELSTQYGSDKFISVDGLVLHDVDIDVIDLGLRVAAIANNTISTELVLSAGEYADVNLAEAVDPHAQYRLETNLYRTTLPNIAGSSVRQDFKVELYEVAQNATDDLNTYARKRLTGTAGYIDALPGEAPVVQQLGMLPTKNISLHPNIILANNETDNPTQGFSFLGMTAASIMAKKEMWLQALAGIDPKSPNSPGGLNIVTNIENDQKGVGTPLDFSSKSVTSEEHYAALQKMYTLAPVISYDVESFGPQAYYTSILAAAAAPASSTAASQSKYEALDEIIETCAQLTNGAFPRDFNPNEVFIGTGNIIPLGYWMDKSGERDIRDIDAAFILNQTGNVELVHKWFNTTLPRDITGEDPFLTRVEIISQLIPDAVINAKAVRVTFTAKFISTLAAGIEAAGLSARYDAGIVISQQYNTSQFTDYLAAAGLSSTHNFATQTSSSGNGLYTGYTDMSYGRF